MEQLSELSESVSVLSVNFNRVAKFNFEECDSDVYSLLWSKIRKNEWTGHRMVGNYCHLQTRCRISSPKNHNISHSVFVELTLRSSRLIYVVAWRSFVLFVFLSSICFLILFNLKKISQRRPFINKSGTNHLQILILIKKRKTCDTTSTLAHSQLNKHIIFLYLFTYTGMRRTQ